MIGYAFMGAVHSQAWRTVGHAFDLPVDVRLAAIGGRDSVAVKAAADRHGWAAFETDWRTLIARDDVAVVDICTPGDTHASIAIEALAAGKHVICEKPLANSVAEASMMADAAASAAARGVRSMVAFNYRRVPALAYARSLVASGRLGTLHHVRAAYQQDWLVDPAAPLTWRMQKERAGSGALGDIAAHIVDAAQFVVGDLLSGVSGMLETFVHSRPLSGGSGLSAASGGSGVGDVTVDDAAVFFGRFAGGGIATFEATRFATGRKNAMQLEIYGSGGGIRFDFERMNELQFFDGSLPDSENGFRRVLVTEGDHPYLEAWWPPGHPLGYEHTFTHEFRDFLLDVSSGQDPSPSFADGLQVQKVLAAVSQSAESGSGWVEV
ncbi:Gfo/Idh/MocA family protein [Cryptosporangium phraense]|uniref:Gfo/Idh/MocA family oxidoreductase n=1 Tax=Cryptosporangium phraense TaxID=2593070 RepID=A0A545AFD5_9ACTN|nr:Gfo/Idh/MocA family oxidoreductase [Cryptosporangium phraense]